MLNKLQRIKDAPNLTAQQRAVKYFEVLAANSKAKMDLKGHVGGSEKSPFTTRQKRTLEGFFAPGARHAVVYVGPDFVHHFDPDDALAHCTLGKQSILVRVLKKVAGDALCVAGGKVLKLDGDRILRDLDYLVEFASFFVLNLLNLLPWRVKTLGISGVRSKLCHLLASSPLGFGYILVHSLALAGVLKEVGGLTHMLIHVAVPCLSRGA